MSLENKVVMITGAAQGIGRSIAEMASELGAKLMLVDMNAEKLDEVMDVLGKDRDRAYCGSVTDAGFVNTTVNDGVKTFGAIHALVNNAGIVQAAMVNKMEESQWDAVIEVNLKGAFLCLQAVGKHMIESAKAGESAPGSIVNVSSDAGRRGTIGQINYGAAKSGMLGLTMSAAREWGRYGIRVNSACFGIIETEMTETIRSEKFIDKYMAQIPMGRIATSEEASKPVCFLISDAASYVTGQHLSINGGYHIGF
jgi:3-oxoacyl-[acyl-carrier protein] reductase